jgi:dTDP-4-amino-4,6-dideoxygalactose transaminase
LQAPEIPLHKVFMADSVGPAVMRTLYSGYIGQGPIVDTFERELAARFGVSRVVTVNSGTSALHLACHMAVDGTADAEIISSPMTCTATNMPIVCNGARIVWADVDPLSGSIDPKAIEQAITANTRAIMMVHWGGNPCDIDKICTIGHSNGIPVIEDAAHALGTTYRGRPVGAHSDFVAFSFQAIKHVTAVDGGCLVCREPEDEARARLLRWYGIDREATAPGEVRDEIDVPEAGYKLHMNDVAATIGRENFKQLDWLIARHRDNARFYDEAFRAANTIAVAPQNPDGASAYWLYTIHLDNRDEVMKGLRERGIGASKVHGRNDTLSAFAAFRRPLPRCEAFDRTHLCIPVGWWVSEQDRERVADCVLALAK